MNEKIVIIVQRMHECAVEMEFWINERIVIHVWLTLENVVLVEMVK
jgi:hypothetical protein